MLLTAGPNKEDSLSLMSRAYQMVVVLAEATNGRQNLWSAPSQSITRRRLSLLSLTSHNMLTQFQQQLPTSLDTPQEQRQGNSHHTTVCGKWWCQVLPLLLPLLGFGLHYGRKCLLVRRWAREAELPQMSSSAGPNRDQPTPISFLTHECNKGSLLPAPEILLLVVTEQYQ